MKKIIPLYEAPVTSYPSIANMLAMSWNKKDEIMPWLADHFVQLIIRPNYDTNVDYYDHAERSQYYRNLFGTIRKRSEVSSSRTILSCKRPWNFEICSRSTA